MLMWSYCLILSQNKKSFYRIRHRSSTCHHVCVSLCATHSFSHRILIFPVEKRSLRPGGGVTKFGAMNIHSKWHGNLASNWRCCWLNAPGIKPRHVPAAAASEDCSWFKSWFPASFNLRIHPPTEGVSPLSQSPVLRDRSRYCRETSVQTTIALGHDHKTCN